MHTFESAYIRCGTISTASRILNKTKLFERARSITGEKGFNITTTGLPAKPVLEFMSHFHLGSSARAKKHVRPSTTEYTITRTHTPPEDSYSSEKRIELFWCCLLESTRLFKLMTQHGWSNQVYFKLVTKLTSAVEGGRYSGRMLFWNTRYIGTKS